MSIAEVRKGESGNRLNSFLDNTFSYAINYEMKRCNIGIYILFLFCHNLILCTYYVYIAKYNHVNYLNEFNEEYWIGMEERMQLKICVWFL